jgi:hypothetical protein
MTGVIKEETAVFRWDIVLLIIFQITGEKHPLFLRIVWLSINLPMIDLRLSVAIFTPQLKGIVLKKSDHNQIVSVDNTLTGLISKRNNMRTI